MRRPKQVRIAPAARSAKPARSSRAGIEHLASEILQFTSSNSIFRLTIYVATSLIAVFGIAAPGVQWWLERDARAEDRAVEELEMLRGFQTTLDQIRERSIEIDQAERERRGNAPTEPGITFVSQRYSRHLAAALFDRISYVRFDLSGLIFDDMDLTGVDLKDADLTETSLIGVHFTRAQSDGATFDRASLRRAVINRARFLNSSFVQTFMPEAEIRRSCLQNSQFFGTVADGSNFSFSNLSGSMFLRPRLIEANFDRAILRNVTFGGDHLGGDGEVIISEVEMATGTRRRFDDVRRQLLDYRQPAFGKTSFIEADLTGATFTVSGADILTVPKAQIPEEYFMLNLFEACLDDATFIVTGDQPLELENALWSKPPTVEYVHPALNTQSGPITTPPAGVCVPRDDIRTLNPCEVDGNRNVWEILAPIGK